MNRSACVAHEGPETVAMETGQQSHRKRPAREIGVPTSDHVVHQLLADLPTALTTKQRLSLLQQIHNTLLSGSWRSQPQQQPPPANVEHLNWFVHLGGVSLLWSQLGVVVDRPWTATAPEVQRLVQTIYAIYRQTTVERSVLLWQHDEDNEPPQDVHLDRQLHVDQEDDDDWPDQLRWLEYASQYPGTLNDVITLAHWLSACPEGTDRMLRSPPLMRRLIDCLGQMNTTETTTATLCSVSQFSSSSSIVSIASMNQNDLLGCFQNLTYFDRQGGRCWGQPDFCRNLTRVRGPKVAAIWRNLAVRHAGRARLKQDVDMPDILYTLAVDNAASHPNVLSTAIHLSMDQQMCLAFLLYGDGLYMTLLEKCLQAMDSTSTRKRAARLVRLWATHETPAHLVVQASSLMGVLSGVAVSDENAQVRREAAEAFGRAATWIQSPMPQHQAVLSALEQLVQSAGPGMVARTLQAQTAVPRNRRLVGENPVLVEALLKICLDLEASSLARQDACRALQHLTQEAVLCPNLVANTRLLDALALNLSAVPAASWVVVQLVQNTEALVNETGNTLEIIPFLTQHDGFLKALIRCAGQPHHPLKDELKQIVLRLVEAL